MSAESLYSQRLARIEAAISLAKPDKVPVVPAIVAFAAHHRGVKMADFLSSPERTHEVMFESYTDLEGIDGVQEVSFSPLTLSTLWLSRVKVPGKELGENDLWQVCEEELMTVEDYDTIIDKGFGPFIADYYANRLDNLGAKLQSYGPHAAYAAKHFRESGLVVMQAGAYTIPFELFCGGRSMAKFSRDLFRNPDKVQAAMDAAMPAMLDMYRQRMQAGKPYAVWVGGWRSASEFLSPKLWERFVWPYLKQVVELVAECGVVPVFHLDSNWTRDLSFFLDLPKAKCVLSLDGTTDIFKAKEVLGNHMCILGDVGASLLTVGTPQQVREYSRRLISEIGPSGFILASGCDVAANAKVENMRAMIEAAQEC